jgi:hypothetical protein
MKDFDHIMSVWQGQPKQDQLSVDDVLKQVKKGMTTMSRKLLFNISTMFVAIVAYCVAMLFLAFKSPITYMGITIILITLILYITMMIRDYKLISNRDATINPIEYLQHLKEYQKNRSKIYGWLYYIFIMSISLGLVLFLFEVLESHTKVFKIVVYSLSAAWFLLCTFYLRKRFVNSEQEKLNLMIDRLVRLQNQFD